MFKSLFDRSRTYTKRLLGLKKSIPRPRQGARTRLMLEALEERALLSMSGNEPTVPSPMMEAERYAVQEAMNYVSSYESTVAAVSRMVATMEQQALLMVTRVDAEAALRVERFIQQILFPTSGANSTRGQSSSTASGLVGGRRSTAPAPSNDPIAKPGADGTHVSEVSSAEDPGQVPGSDTPLSSPAQSLNTGTSFAGLGEDGYWPPDTNAAVGPNCIVEVVNQKIAIYDKTGNLLSSETLQAFFGISTYVTDPVVIYDDQADRFVVTDDQLNQSTGDTHLLLAVSNTSSPTNLSTDFTEKQSIDVTETNSNEQTLWVDQPQLGWNADAYVISMNMYTVPTSSPTFDHVQLLTIQKSSVLDKNPSTLTDYRVDYSGSAFSLAPARMHGSASGDPMWFAQQWSQSGSSYTGIDIVKMTNVLNSNPTFVATYVPTIDYNNPHVAPQPGGDSLDTNDPRIVAPDWRNGTLATAQAVGLGSDNEGKVQWAEISTNGSAPALVQQGTIDPGSGVYTYVPSIAIDANGDLGLTYLQSSSTQYLSMYITGRAKNDPTGTMETPTEAFAGQATYTNGADPQRTGDYSGVSVDPSSPSTFWAANEYATTGSSPNWGTGIAEFSVAPSSYWQTVDLSSYYNRDGLTWGGTTITGGGLDGYNDDLEDYGSFGWQGATIYPAKPNVPDVVSAQGKTITLPAGQYSTLTLFATAVNGNQAIQNFTVNYSTGPSQTFTRSFTNWLSAPGGYSDELQVMRTDAFNPDGTVKGPAYFSAYALSLDPSRTVTSITLPNDDNIEILAMELS